MLSYQHIYHAGNFADLHKHSALCALWDVLEQNNPDAPRLYIDTHAGRGVYDLSAPEAQKIKEYKDAFLKLDLARLPKDFSLYKHALKQYAPNYPGSAGCIAAIKKRIDQMLLCELHPKENKHLIAALGKVKNCRVLKKDGHVALSEIVSEYKDEPTLCAIDPSYEVKSEYAKTAQTALHAMNLNKKLSVLIWYPVLAGEPYYEQLLAPIKEHDVPQIHSKLNAPTKTNKGMVATGLVILNPPEGFAPRLDRMTKFLDKIL